MTMPLRFSCQHCGQLFSVSADKAGVQLDCPKCQASITVPTSDDLAHLAAFEDVEITESPSSPSTVVAESSPPPDVPQPDATQPDAPQPDAPQPESNPDREGPPVFRQAATDPSSIDYRKLAVSRKVVYTQGVLLGVVGLVAFILGILVARTWPDSPDMAAGEAGNPVTVRGQIRHAADGGRVVPDVGCVVLAVPAESLPDEKLDFAGLRPQDPPLRGDHPTAQALRVLGGAHTRTDRQGSFQLDLPRGGTYFFLLLSANARRGSPKMPDRRDLAELGRYVTSAYDLLGPGQYRWTERRLRNDATLDWQFDRTTK